jgi:hypothetical protein
MPRRNERSDPFILVKIKSLGPKWMINDSAYRRNPKHYARIKLYNTTGFVLDGRVVTKWIIPGYIRFKNQPYFDLDCPESVTGRMFRCTRLGSVDGKRTLLVLDVAPIDAIPSFYLTWVTSREIGYVDLSNPAEVLSSAEILAASAYGIRQNMLCLLKDRSTIRASKGIFSFDLATESLETRNSKLETIFRKG